MLARCGRPTYRDAYQVPLAPGLSVDLRVSVWYYDRGPRRLIAVLHFEQDVLLRIGTAGYGFGDSPPKHCEPPQISVGMTKYELLQTCGEPRRRSAIEGLWSPARGLPPGNYRPSRLERWTYVFGAGWLPRVVELRDGVVDEVEVPSGQGEDP